MGARAGTMDPANRNDAPADPERNAENMRSHRRVEARLRVAVILDRETACIAHTVNMSEGGMLLSDYHGPHLQRGRLVGLSMRGVVSDKEDAESDHYLMRVVRQHGEVVALRFADDE